MPRTPEGKMKDKVTKLLKKHKVWYFFPQSGPHGRSGIPDIVCCYFGTFIGIEVKANSKSKVTALQSNCLDQIVFAGGRALVVCNANTLQMLEHILITMKVEDRINAGY